jgi:ribosomal protein S3AE
VKSAERQNTEKEEEIKEQEKCCRNKMAQAKRKQKFFDVSMPVIKKETQLYGYELKELNGRIIIYDLTRLLKGKGVLLKLKVSVEGDKAVAEPIELKILPYFIRRMMRKGVNYVEDSFSAECKDAVLRIKPFLITRKKVSRAVRKALREKTKEELTNYVKTTSSKTLFDEIMKNKIQRSLGLKLKKIYPLSLCEIRFFAIENR